MMTDNNAARRHDTHTTAALLQSMRVVHHTLTHAQAFSPDQLARRIEEWEDLVRELSQGDPEEQARLATLYEVSTALNSSLNLSQTLNQVMDSLIQLTGAERGGLMLLDQEGDLEVRAARNFDREDIATADLGLSRTVIEDVVEGGQPVLTTNAQADPRFAAHESVIGYNLRSIACVPLRVRERVIGALYLDNRIKCGVFSDQDLPTLTAFANQAAIAIENARLYTMTDRALAARLEELTTLQRIDRELNASLDFERVLDLTLTWALQATGSKEGALGVLDEDGTLRVASTEGCALETQSDAARLAMKSSEPITIGSRRLLVPIRWEKRAIGMLDLRRNGEGPFQPEHAQFASRLADHAAVAIQNAMLYQKVQQANLAKSEFISFVAHELRTPMTSIRGYADLMSKGIVGPMTDEQREFVGTIIGNVQRMQVLVSDLQDVSRIETGRLRLEVAPTRFRDALDDALQSVQGQMEARAQTLTLELAADVPQIRADPDRLTQILTNLLSNAHKYTPEGGEVRVRTWVADAHLHCAVADTGIGISPEDQQRLFTKFFRSEDPAVREMPGTGLGLCIVKSLVELQGGEMTVESALREGTTFTFTLPIATG
jgi:signal transduction histidine kinase